MGIFQLPTLVNPAWKQPRIAEIDKQGALLLVEVERDTGKIIEHRQAIWRNF